MDVTLSGKLTSERVPQEECKQILIVQGSLTYEQLSR